MKKLLIWGTGDQGLVSLEVALQMECYDKIDFVEINEKKSRFITGHQVYREDELKQIVDNYDEVIVATGNNSLREVKNERLLSLQIPLATLIHPSAIISPSAKIGKGTTILANTIVNINAVIGKGCIINNGAIVEHDCIVGDYVNICPGSTMAGHVSIGYKSYVAIGAAIIDNIKIGNNVTVGAGAVVIRNIPDDRVVVGVPAKVIK